MGEQARLVAGFVQGTLEAIDRQDAELGARVRAALAPQSRESLASASRVSLIPVALDLEITERLYDLAGEARARAILRANLAATFEAPLLRSFTQMALRLSGADPSRVLEWTSKVWHHLYRDCGDLRYLPVDETSGRVEATDLPDLLLAHPRYWDGVAATLSAVFDLVRVRGAGALESVDPDRRVVRIAVSWEPAG